MKTRLWALPALLLVASGCITQSVSVVDPGTGCCVSVSEPTSWPACTYRCSDGGCIADQPHALRSGLGTSRQTVGQKVSATIDLSCDP